MSGDPLPVAVPDRSALAGVAAVLRFANEIEDGGIIAAQWARSAASFSAIRAKAGSAVAVAAAGAVAAIGNAAR
jgi:hypothetical protein